MIITSGAEFRISNMIQDSSIFLGADGKFRMWIDDGGGGGGNIVSPMLLFRYSQLSITVLVGVVSMVRVILSLCESPLHGRCVRWLGCIVAYIGYGNVVDASAGAL